MKLLPKVLWSFALIALTFACLLHPPLAASQSTPEFRQLGMVDVPGRPGFGALAFANGMLIMTHTSASTVDVFDPVRRRVMAQITGLQAPSGIAVDEKGGTVYVGDTASHSIAIIRSGEWKLDGTIPVGSSPDSLLLDGNGMYLYWGDSRTHSVSVLDLTTRQKVGSLPLDGSPAGMAYDQSRNAIFITLQDRHELLALSPRLELRKRYVLRASQPTDIIYDPNTRCLYIAVRYAVLSFNPDTGAEVDRVPAPAGTDTLWLDREGRIVYAAGGGSVLMLRANGERLTLAGEISTDVKGHTVAYDAKNRMLLVPGGREGKSKLLLLRPFSPDLPREAEQSATAKVH